MRSWVKFGIDPLQRGVIGPLNATTPRLISKSNYRSLIASAKFLQISLSIKSGKYHEIHRATYATARKRLIAGSRGRGYGASSEGGGVKGGWKGSTRKVKVRIIQIKTDR